MPKSKTKKKSIFSLETDEYEIDMCVNKSNYNHFQSLPPIQQKALIDLMTMKFLQEMYD